MKITFNPTTKVQSVVANDNDRIIQNSSGNYVYLYGISSGWQVKATFTRRDGFQIGLIGGVYDLDPDDEYCYVIPVPSEATELDKGLGLSILIYEPSGETYIRHSTVATSMYVYTSNNVIVPDDLDTVLYDALNLAINNLADSKVEHNAIVGVGGETISKDTPIYSKLKVDEIDTAIVLNINAHKARTNNPHGVTKAQVGLENVDNTSDLNKPISTAQQAALDTKANLTGGNSFTGNQAINGTINAEGIVVVNASITSQLNKNNTKIVNLANGVNNNDAVNKGQLDLKVDKAQSIIGINLQDDILLTEFKTALGNATQSVAGLLSAEDKTHLDGLVALLESSDGNNVVDTIGEILAIFNNYPEGADLVTVLNGKVDKVAGKALSQNDFTDALKNKLDGLLNGSQYYDKTYIDALKDQNGWESELLTLTPLAPSGTIATATLLLYNTLKLQVKNTSTSFVDTDSVEVSLGVVTGNKIQLSDTSVYLEIGATNSTFVAPAGWELQIVGLKYTELKAVDTTYDNTTSGMTATTVQDAIDEIESEKEDVANKVTEWSETPSDTNYPSEKLVKDSLDDIRENDILDISEMLIGGTGFDNFNKQIIPIEDIDTNNATVSIDIADDIKIIPSTGVYGAIYISSNIIKFKISSTTTPFILLGYGGSSCTGIGIYNGVQRRVCEFTIGGSSGSFTQLLSVDSSLTGAVVGDEVIACLKDNIITVFIKRTNSLNYVLLYKVDISTLTGATGWQTNPSLGFITVTTAGYIDKEFYEMFNVDILENGGNIVNAIMLNKQDIQTLYNKFVSLNLAKQFIQLDGYFNKSGVFISESNTYCFYGEVEPSKAYIQSFGTAIYNVFFDEEEEFLSYTDINTAGYFLTPNTAKYCAFQFRKSEVPVISALIYKGTKLGDGSEIEIPNLSVNIDNEALKNKKWTSFGDSITYRNKWQPYVISLFDLIHTNLGIGSTSLALSSLPNAFCEDTRLDDVIESNPDIITIMGGTNDCHVNVPLGTTDEFKLDLEDKEKTTFYGAYSYIVETLLAWKPTVRLILLTTMQGTQDVGKTHPYQDYADATKKVAYYYSLPCVDIFGSSGISKQTVSAYFEDAYHPNDAGGKRIAERVIDEFKKIL